VLFLTADAFGVLPPVSILDDAATQYHFLSGFTAKMAGMERGMTEHQPTFSACFGAAFLSLHPTTYAEVLSKRMRDAGAKAYLINTGWNGQGTRISLKNTRALINAMCFLARSTIADTETLPIFQFANAKNTGRPRSVPFLTQAQAMTMLPNGKSGPAILAVCLSKILKNSPIQTLAKHWSPPGQTWLIIPDLKSCS
jgi:hypothetical protein